MKEQSQANPYVFKFRRGDDITFILNNRQVQQFLLLSFYTLTNNTKLNNIGKREAWMHKS